MFLYILTHNYLAITIAIHFQAHLLTNEYKFSIQNNKIQENITTLQYFPHRIVRVVFVGFRAGVVVHSSLTIANGLIYLFPVDIVKEVNYWQLIFAKYMPSHMITTLDN